MATEKLSVENFGPIQKADLDLRKVTVLIGEQASGKSVLAKLVALSRKQGFLIKNKKGKWWENDLNYFALDGFYSEKSFFSYDNEDFNAVFQESKLTLSYNNLRLKNLSDRIRTLGNRQDTIEKDLNNAFEKENFEKASELETEKGQNSIELVKLNNELKLSFLSSEYIPAERVVVSFIRCHRFEDIYLNDFINTFTERRSRKVKTKIFPFDVEYRYDDKNDDDYADKILIGGKDSEIQLYQAASGIQSLVPMEVIIETANPRQKHIFIVEEPELNLFPTIQNKLVQYLIEKCTKGDNRLIITTHSSYILTALSNLIEAKNVVKQNPDLHEAVAQIIPPQYWLDFDDVSAYFVGGGTAYSIRDEENQNIDANPIDAVSNETGRIFDQLLDLKYATTA